MRAKTRFLVLALLLVALGVGGYVAVRLLLGPDMARSAIARQASAALGEPVTIGTAQVQLWPQVGLRLGDVRVGEPAHVRLARVRISTGLWPLVSRRVEDAAVLVEDSRVDVIELFATLDRLRTRDDSAPEGSSAGLTIASVRTIGLHDVVLVLGPQEATVTIDSSLEGDRLDISRLTVQSAHASLDATGSVESLARRVARLSIDADPLDLDGLLEFAAALSDAASTSADQSPDGDPAPLDVGAEVRAARGRAAGMTFTNLDTTVTLTPDTVALDPLTLELLDGRLEGDITILTSAQPPEVTVAGRVDGVDLQQVAALAGEPTAVTGTLNGRFTMTGRGLDQASVLQQARGTAEVTLVDGRMPGLDLVRPVVLFFGHPSGAPPDGSGETFERIAATLTIDGGEIRTSDLVLESRDVDVTGAGRLATGSGALDVKANLLLSEELSAQAGRDLARYAREGDRVVLPATISGTVAAPRVMIDEQEAVHRALRNEIERRTKSLLERVLPRK